MARDSEVSSTTQQKKPAPTRKQTAAPAAQTSGNDRVAFANSVLQGLGAPATSANVNALLSWMNHEGTAAAFNPLATTQGYDNSTALSGNSAGVQNYSSFNDGVAATVQTLQNGHYNGIIQAFKAGKPEQAPPNEVSTWSGGGYTSFTGGAATNAPLSTHVGGGPGASAPMTPGTTGSTGAAGQPSTTVDMKTLAGEFGFAYSFFNSDPELKQLLQKAFSDPRGQWTPERFAAELKNTNWYKTHLPAQRQWIALQTSDPTGANDSVRQKGDDLGQIAHQLGFSLSGDQQRNLAYEAVTLGWSPQETQAAVANLYTYKPGDISPIADSLKKDASSYLLPLSDQALSQWTTNIVQGRATEQQFQAYAKEQAKSMFPGMGAAIDAGTTVAQYVDPYKQIAAQTLEVPPDSINFMDPKWGKALFQVDPKTGARTSMSLSDWTNELRTNPIYGYDTTTQARTTAADLTTSLAKEFGAVG